MTQPRPLSPAIAVLFPPRGAGVPERECVQQRLSVVARPHANPPQRVRADRPRPRSQCVPAPAPSKGSPAAAGPPARRACWARKTCRRAGARTPLRPARLPTTAWARPRRPGGPSWRYVLRDGRHRCWLGGCGRGEVVCEREGARRSNMCDSTLRRAGVYSKSGRWLARRQGEWKWVFQAAHGCVETEDCAAALLGIRAGESRSCKGSQAFG